MIKQIKRKYTKLHSKIKYFNLSLLFVMIFNVVFTLFLRTPKSSGKKTLWEVEMVTYLVLDLARMLCNLLIMWIGKNLPNYDAGEVFLTDPKESLLTKTTAKSKLEVEENIDEKYFACEIKTDKVTPENEHSFYEFSVVFKPLVYQHWQLEFISMSTINNEEENITFDEGKNLLNDMKTSNRSNEKYINRSIDLFFSPSKGNRCNDYNMEIKKILQKESSKILDFINEIIKIGNPKVLEYEFFDEIDTNALDLENLQIFLNFFMNETHKFPEKYRPFCRTLNSIKTFLELDHKEYIPNLLNRFSLYMEFPIVFSPNKDLFRKIFNRFLITKISIDDETEEVKLRVLDKFSEKRYKTKMKLTEIFKYLQRLHPFQTSIDFTDLFSEKKQQQIMYLVQMLLNEMQDSSVLSSYLGEEIKQEPELDFVLPKFEMEVSLTTPPRKTNDFFFQDLDPNFNAKNVTWYKIKVKFEGKTGFVLIERSEEHFTVLSDHLLSRFNKNKYQILNFSLQSVTYVQEYLTKLVKNKQVWKSIEFQLFMNIARTEFINSTSMVE